jgi:hypothetical protein
MPRLVEDGKKKAEHEENRTGHVGLFKELLRWRAFVHCYAFATPPALKICG